MGMCGACCQPRRYQLIGTFTYGECVYVCVCIRVCVYVCVWVWVGVGVGVGVGGADTAVRASVGPVWQCGDGPPVVLHSHLRLPAWACKGWQATHPRPCLVASWRPHASTTGAAADAVDEGITEAARSATAGCDTAK